MAVLVVCVYVCVCVHWGVDNGSSQAISERSGAVFCGAVRSAKLALISPVVGDV